AEHVLDLEWVDVVGAPEVHVPGTAYEDQVACRGEEPEVARPQPPLGVEGVAGSPGVAPVAPHDARPAHADLAHLAGREATPVSVDRDDVHALLRTSHRPELDFGRVFGRGPRDARGLGHRVTDDQWRA